MANRCGYTTIEDYNGLKMPVIIKDLDSVRDVDAEEAFGDQILYLEREDGTVERYDSDTNARTWTPHDCPCWSISMDDITELPQEIADNYCEMPESEEFDDASSRNNAIIAAFIECSEPESLEFIKAVIEDCDRWTDRFAPELKEFIAEKAPIEKRELRPDVKIWLCPTYDIAVKQKDALEAEGHVVACSEAEYGELEVTGSRDGLSLAHHGPREANPAPCLAENLDQQDVPTAFLVSHIDLDAVGGILALHGIKPKNDKFWEAAAFIDVNGIHHIHELDQSEQDKLNAVYAWNAQQDRLNTRGVTEPIDVTAQVNAWKKALDIILDPREPEHDAMIEAGREWEQNASKAVEEKLVFENENIRAFITDGVFCSASYYSPNRQEVVPATIVYNKKFDSITVAFEDGGKAYSAKEIVQALWGPEAGGHGGIAGSPRGQTMTEEQFIQAVSAVNTKYEEKRLEQSIRLGNIRSVDIDGMSLVVNKDIKVEPTSDFGTISQQLGEKYQITDKYGYPVKCAPDTYEVQMFVKSVYDLAQRNVMTGAMNGPKAAIELAEVLASAIEDSSIALQAAREDEAISLAEILEDDVRDAIQEFKEPKNIDEQTRDDEAIGDSSSTQNDDEGLH